MTTSLTSRTISHNYWNSSSMMLLNSWKTTLGMTGSSFLFIRHWTLYWKNKKFSHGKGWKNSILSCFIWSKKKLEKWKILSKHQLQQVFMSVCFLWTMRKQRRVLFWELLKSYALIYQRLEKCFRTDYWCTLCHWMITQYLLKNKVKNWWTYCRKMTFCRKNWMLR